MKKGEGRPGFPGERGEIFIEGVRHRGRTVDVFVDGNGRIARIGKGVGKRDRRDAATRIEGKNLLLIPGLVNTHTHAAMTLLRGYADDMPLQEWLTTKIWPLEAHLTGEDVYRGTRLACLEMIRSGTTAFNDMYFFMEEAARAAGEMGLRATLSHGFIDLGDPDKREKEIAATERFVSAVNGMGHPRIRPAVGPHAVYTVSPDGLRWCAEFAREEGIGIHVHLAETGQEVQDCVVARGKRPAAHLDACGCLTERTVAAHCCWLDREECALLAARGVSASHNPASNLKLAVGRAMPYPLMKEAGMNVTLGTDGCASNNSLDMFGAMKTAALLQKFAWGSQTALPAPEVLELATAAGARALGIPSGNVEAGAPADLVLVNLASPAMTPLFSEESNLVYSATGSCVDTVICDGRILMLHGEVPGEEEILAEAAASAAALVKRAGM
ncbi:MAG TPA: amidohydrolase [Methanomicrobiales archaeon]|jgi:5-methylthioadenosine/S-adenosylhomocysteine deaminase|nr:amidohydrolase [Methanomicrobiales archaeon]